MQLTQVVSPDYWTRVATLLRGSALAAHDVASGAVMVQTKILRAKIL